MLNTFNREEIAIMLDALSHFSDSLTYAMQHKLLAETMEQMKERNKEEKDCQEKVDKLVERFNTMRLALDILNEPQCKD